MILDAPDGRGRQYHWLQHLTHHLPFTAEGRRVLFIPVNPRLFFSDEQWRCAAAEERRTENHESKVEKCTTVEKSVENKIRTR